MWPGYMVVPWALAIRGIKVFKHSYCQHTILHFTADLYSSAHGFYQVHVGEQL